MVADEETQVPLREVALDDIVSAKNIRDLVMLETAERQVTEHVSSDLSVEKGGALVGQVDEQTGALRISAAVPSYRAQGTAASLTFTHDAWDEINQAVSERFPDQRIVGWYHSHPDFGIFLSQYDKFIQENFFTASWQVAYVVDPVRRQAGLFGWESGAVVSIPRWQGMDATGQTTTRTNGHGMARDRGPGTRAAPFDWGNAVRVGFFALIIGLVGGFFIGKAVNSPSLASGTLPVVNMGPGLTVVRSWAASGSSAKLSVTVDNPTGVSEAGTIENCAPAVRAAARPVTQSCSFATKPLAPDGSRTFVFSVPAPADGSNPWAGLAPPSYVASSQPRHSLN